MTLQDEICATAKADSTDTGSKDTKLSNTIQKYLLYRWLSRMWTKTAEVHLR